MEDKLNHFSHDEHPLMLSQVHQKRDSDDVDDGKEIICYGCQEQILEAEAYSCIPCDFFLHKRCAELPLKIRHPLHSQHALVLLKEPPRYYTNWSCDACHQYDWKFFTYHCSWCEFDLHLSCAMVEWKFKEEVVDRRLEHECHEHPLILQQRPAIFFCDGCCTEDEDSSSYLCTTCPFWIHKRCASLPSRVYHKDHNHSLLLAYSLPSEHRSFQHKCPVCQGKVLRNHWVYYCGPCTYFVHVKCVQLFQDTEQENEYIIEGELDSEYQDKCTPREKKEEDQCAYNQNLVRLPSTHATQELITRSLLKRDQSSSDSSSETRIREKVVVEDHKHPLILSKTVQTKHEIKSTEGEEVILVCDWCIEPISLSDLHYTCEECCGYFLHETCFNLPRKLQIANHPEHLLSLMYRRDAVGYFRCNACNSWSNGSFYICKPCDLWICVKCASASMIPSVAHDAHEHPLTQFESSNPIGCSVCIFKRGNYGFACEDCHFYLDYECALLPPTHKWRWHDHPLILMYPPYFEHPEEFYCLICELEINANCWMYHCRDFDYSLHPWCIPQIGLFGSVKFGRFICVNNHSHPLTHITEAKYESFCESCNKSLDWKDAFECDACRFYLCSNCAFEREMPLL